MKTTIIIKDKLYQLVLTPETTHEKTVLKLMKERERLSIYYGSYTDTYRCQGGWFREERNDMADSLILLLEQKEVEVGGN